MHDETKKENLMEALALTRSLLKQNPTKKIEPTKHSEQSIARMDLSKIKR